jgi:hypothetical protein
VAAAVAAAAGCECKKKECVEMEGVFKKTPSFSTQGFLLFPPPRRNEMKWRGREKETRGRDGPDQGPFGFAFVNTCLENVAGKNKKQKTASLASPH